MSVDITTERDVPSMSLYALADKYRRRIDKTLTREMRLLNYKTRSALGRRGLVDTALGRGAWGIVFETTDPRWVWKITLDPDEGPVIAAIMDDPTLHEHPGCCYFGGVWRFPEGLPMQRKDDGSIVYYEVYLVLREEIKPRKVKSAEKTGKKTLTIEHNLLHIRDVAADFNLAVLAGDARKAENYWDKWAKKCAKLMESEQTRDLADFMLAFVESQGGMLADVHLANVGYRRHHIVNPPNKTSWVFFDPGVSQVHDERTIPMISNPRINTI